MNVIKTLRKPYLSIFLSALVLFVSCSQYDNDINEVEENLSLSEFVEKHLELSSSVLSLINDENKQDILALENIEETLTYNQLNKVLADANIKESDAIAGLLNEMYLNGKRFSESNPDFQNDKKSDLEILISQEIDKQLNNSYLRASGPCQDAYHTAQGRCTRNYAISSGVAVAVGLGTAGFGWLFGAGAALVVYTLCMTDAESDLEDCLDQ
ncbi:MAG: hypothetical protein ABF274_13375 [Nonlabens sp.]|uniref:hypothetical protein n=1 Tax=Nonlabens sp. TaxID=1888209 RepID=UPI00321A8676